MRLPLRDEVDGEHAVDRGNPKPQGCAHGGDLLTCRNQEIYPGRVAELASPEPMAARQDDVVRGAKMFLAARLRDRVHAFGTNRIENARTGPRLCARGVGKRGAPTR